MIVCLFMCLSNLTLPFPLFLSPSFSYGNFLPYSDFFIGDMNPSTGMFIDERACQFEGGAFRPARRMWVYNYTFQVNVPNDFNYVLEQMYGPDWRTPDKSSSPHGNTACAGKGNKYWRSGEQDTKWLDMWNEILDREA